jgi:hypothetical protein
MEAVGEGRHALLEARAISLSTRLADVVDRQRNSSVTLRVAFNRLVDRHCGAARFGYEGRVGPLGHLRPAPVRSATPVERAAAGSTRAPTLYRPTPAHAPVHR